MNEDNEEKEVPINNTEEIVDDLDDLAFALLGEEGANSSEKVLDNLKEENNVNENESVVTEEDVEDEDTDESEEESIVTAKEIPTSSSVQSVSDEEIDAILKELGADVDDPIFENIVNNDDKEINENIPNEVFKIEEVDQQNEDILTTAEEEKSKEDNKISINISIPDIKPFIDKFNVISNKKVAIILVASIFLISMSGVILSLMFNRQATVELPIQEGEQVILVRQNNPGANNANFIFVSQERGHGSSNFFMSRMLLDPFATIFYFNDYVDWQNYTVELKDDMLRTIPLSLLHFSNVYGNTLSFNPVYTDTRGIVLSITNVHTMEVATFPIEFYGNVFRLPSSHLIERSYVQLNENIITVTGGQFSTAGSSIFYHIQYHGASFNFQHILLNSGAQMLPLLNHQSFDIAPGQVIGRLDFGPLPSVNGNVSLIFSDLFLQYEVDEAINIQGLFANVRQNWINLDIGDGNTLVLERLGRRNEEFILVLHGTNAYGVRQETRINATIEATDVNDTSVSLYPTIFSGEQGSDLVFDIMSPLSTNLSNINLQLNHVYFGVSNLLLNISLNNTSNTLRPSDAQFIQTATEELLQMGYDMVSPITFTSNGLGYFGAFRVANYLNEVNDYIVYAQRTQYGWSFDITQLYSG